LEWNKWKRNYQVWLKNEKAFKSFQSVSKSSHILFPKFIR
jgi:hypothetical protein